MMNSSNTQPQWALIGVRVCAVYLALWAIACITLLFIGFVYGSSVGALIVLLLLPATLLGLHALKLWQLQSSWRGSATQILMSMALISIPLVVNHTDWKSLANVVISFVPAVVGVISLVFLNLRAVKALFENPQSAINSPKS